VNYDGLRSRGGGISSIDRNCQLGHKPPVYALLGLLFQDENSEKAPIVKAFQ
jgi:hypothetical protein